MATTYTFTDVINPADPTFNQELGINNSGVIAGYNGSGVPGHPNQGYTTSTANLTSFTSENFPGSVQTQVTGINNRGNTVGFYSPTNNGSDANFGFYNKTPGSYTAVVNPLTTSTPSVNQLLGINSSGIAAGFYNDASGNSHGYTYDTLTGAFTPVVDPSVTTTSLQATAINNADDVAGFLTAGGKTSGFVDIGGVFKTFNAPKSTSTEAFGINNRGQVVGTSMGAGGKTFGFLYTISTGKFQFLSDPNGVGATAANGINDAGDIVGFYTNPTNGYTIGMLATPVVPRVAETGATTQSFDAWSLLASDAGMPSGFHHETARVNDALNVTVDPHETR